MTRLLSSGERLRDGHCDMGGSGSTRRVSFEADENDNITVVKGIRVSGGGHVIEVHCVCPRPCLLYRSCSGWDSTACGGLILIGGGVCVLYRGEGSCPHNPILTQHVCHRREL